MHGGPTTIVAGEPGGPARPRVERRFRRAAAAVLVALLAGSVVTSLVVRRVIADQERILLGERATKTAAFLASLFEREAAGLALLSVVGGTHDGPSALQAASGLVLGRAPGTISLLERAGGGTFVVTAVAGEPPPAAGPAPAGDTLVSRASRADGLVGEVRTGDGGHLVRFAVADATRTRVVLHQSPASAYSSLGSGPGSPFGALQGALYAAEPGRRGPLVFSTRADGLPEGSGTVVRPVAVGADTWSVAVRARHSLVGDVARFAWLLVLLPGLAATGLVGALVAVMGRRRAYALALVEQRTEALRDALAEREEAEAGERAAREAAESANRSKSEFLSRMSHELRTPLNAIIGFAQLLESETLEPSQRDSVAQILSGGRHLLDLVDEVLDIARIETGHLSLSSEPVHAWRAIEEVVDLTRPLAAQRGIQLLCPPHEDEELYVRADAQRLRQVVLNLVSNAVKYNHEGGLVTLSCARETPGSLRINVADNGPGIPSDRLDRLFAPFERLGAEHTAVEGTGIGLALSSRLAEAMGSELAVVTEVGAGSTFSLVLPMVEGTARRPTAPCPPGERRPSLPAADPGVRRTVVYIEDNEINLRLVEGIFRGDDVQVISAPTGGLGIELVRVHQPSLVLLDLHLPDLDGSEVLARLRAQPETSSIPVVVLSADATPGQADRLRHLGAVDYLTKPLDVHHLRAVAAALWARAR